MVAFPMSGRPFSEFRKVSCFYNIGMEFNQLSILVFFNYDLGICELSDDALNETDYCLCPFYHEAILIWFQVQVEDVDLLTAQLTFDSSDMIPASSPC